MTRICFWIGEGMLCVIAIKVVRNFRSFEIDFQLIDTSNWEKFIMQSPMALKWFLNFTGIHVFERRIAIPNNACIQLRHVDC